MYCADTLGVICCFLQKRELVEVSNVSRLCRAATTAFICERERRYFVHPCLREDCVELVPPSQILALRFLEEERKLLVLVRVSSPMLGEEIECSLYVQEALPEGSRSDHRVDLPTEFALPTSHVHFEGDRFLCCTSREGGLTIFDCVAETLLELPIGYDGFHASPNGRRCLVDYNRQLYYCASDTCITLWWEMLKGSSASSPTSLLGHDRQLRGMGSSDRQPSVAAKLRGRLSVENPLLSYPLGNSSSAWRAFWVGQSSVLYAHEQGVMLLKERGTPATSRATVLRCSDEDALSLPATCPLTFQTVALPELADLSCALAHNSASTVSNSNGEADEYIIFNCRNSGLHTITVRPGDSSDERGGIVVSHANLQTLIPPRSCIIKEVRVAVPTSTYMVFLNDHHEDRLLFFTADLTLSRWITIGEPSAMTLLVNDGIVITAALPNAVLWNHPMIQTIEGGAGSVFSFSEEFGPDVLDPTMTSITVASSYILGSKEEAVCSGLLPWYRLPIQSFNGVEFLSWAALGIVSACLVWTVSALAYNGWWLHLQLLFWGKVN